MIVKVTGRRPWWSRAVGVVTLALLAGIAACGGSTTGTEAERPDSTAPGPHSEGGEAFVVYPENLVPFMESFSDFESRWSATTGDLGFPPFADIEEGVRSTARVDNALRVWVDLAMDGDAVRIAQLTIENRATDSEDSVYVDQLMPAFLSAAGITTVPSELGISDIEELFDEARTAQVTVDGRTIHLAVNKWSLVLGVTGG